MGNLEAMTIRVTASEMKNAIPLSQTPEEQELENKLAELAALETDPTAEQINYFAKLFFDALTY